ncbi:RNA polymerase subunit sigma [Bremerella cremea]|uniref:RNA polymerase subunit sigma n=1 Tax=Blastopirellula marina TaxID=124 RepID=A0A2S8FFD6_9BACT|nr:MULTISPECIES: sigma-70 family RNA polymerase sigma factor [Pirellulaceae]PQO30891.1 RNA polymerase subunit sigma [Blastopirellula marina]RCS44038.1 RNA polymerase subunit sigma [Bremerella cremea]
MGDVTRILSQIETGDRAASEDLLPLVYDELRKLAAAKLAQERPGQTLQATALVHEAYVRLTNDPSPSWDNKGHFFAAAAEAMRRILVEQARRKSRLKHGGNLHRVEMPEVAAPEGDSSERILAVDLALTRLDAEDPQAAEIVKLHYFAGLSLEEVGKVLGMSRATAYRQWTYARSWLKSEVESDS